MHGVGAAQRWLFQGGLDAVGAIMGGAHQAALRALWVPVSHCGAGVQEHLEAHLRRSTTHHFVADLVQDLFFQ